MKTPNPIIGCLLATFLAVFTSAAAGDSVTNAVAPKNKSCFECKGTGTTRCPALTCTNGQVDCPAPCMRLSKGVWKHMNVAGHDPSELWQSFHGKTKIMSWNHHHVGDLIQMQNGEPVNTGPCKTCGGNTRVKCVKCNGTSEITCPVCDGKKQVPDWWSLFDHPKLKNRPSRFKLKDGRELLGRKVATMGDRTRIRTETGDVDINSADILSEEKQQTQK